MRTKAYEAIRKAVLEALDEIGIEGLKKTSFFLSNHKTSRKPKEADKG